MEDMRTVYTTLRQFIGKSQLAAMVNICKGPDGPWMRMVMRAAAIRIAAMPQTYDTDGQGDAALVHLHYFRGDRDYYITEKDKEAQQHQAFGYADFHDGCAELGYISLVELCGAGVDFDLYWTPKPLKDVKGN